jgi:hypothetical protein
MHKTKYRKTTCARPPGVKSDLREGKIEILEKQLSLTAQTHYADLQETCRDKVTKVCVIVRYIKKVIEKERRLGSNFTPDGLLRVKVRTTYTLKAPGDYSHVPDTLLVNGRTYSLASPVCVYLT